MSWNTGIGPQMTAYAVPPLLAPICDAHPVGLRVFLRWCLGAPSTRHERQLPWSTGLVAPIYSAHPVGLQVFLRWRLGVASTR
jgi:hypothetical protein